jgi:hypothetical protein
MTVQLESPDMAAEMLSVELATPMLAAIVQYSDDAIIGKDLYRHRDELESGCRKDLRVLRGRDDWDVDQTHHFA